MLQQAAEIYQLFNIYVKFKKLTLKQKTVKKERHCMLPAKKDI